MFKRLFDICFSLGMLILTAPFFLGVAYLIKASSPGPIFYGGFRYGKDRKIFKCWKFRTMHLGADEKLKKILEDNPELKEEWQKFRKIKDDPRVFPFGRFLRKYSLDELPQFWNVLRGEMSVVGPRAYLLQEVDEELKERASKILSMHPGITGLWQTSGRNLLSFEERIRCDETYVDNQALSYDLFLVFKTFLLLFNPKGAF